MSDTTDADGLLDVFTSVEVEESPISARARELGDVSMHSLLEQTRQLASEMRRARGFS